MKTSIALAILISDYHLSDSSGYEVKITVSASYEKSLACRKCLQRFVPHANFTFGFFNQNSESLPYQQPVSLEMFAEITDDIPYGYIGTNCHDVKNKCTLIKGQKFNVPVEDKKLYNILAKAEGSADARGDMSRRVQSSRIQSKREMKKLRLFGVDIDSGASDSHDALERISYNAHVSAGESSEGNELAYGGGTNKRSNNFPERQRPHHSVIGKDTTHCLLLPNYLPEIWMLGCFRCLAPGDEDKRYFVSTPGWKDYQFALYTTTETREKVEENCKSSCGTIGWGSKKDCLVVSLYASIHSESSDSASFPDFSYFELQVTHMDNKMEGCVHCIGSIVGLDFQYVRETARHFNVYVRESTKQKLQECKRVGYCEKIDENPGRLPGGLSNFKLSPSSASESAASSTTSEKRRIATYQCMQQSPENSANEQKNLSVDLSVGKGYFAFKKTCVGCILQSPAIKTSKVEFEHRPTSTRSSLLFFSKAVDVHEIAISCWKLCEWISGLSKSMCELLGLKERVGLEDTKMSTVPPQSFLVSSPDSPGETVLLHDAVKYLHAKTSKDFVWFIQFNIADRMSKNIFEETAFCIAKVSNTYALSAESGYILTSHFKYEHVKFMCPRINHYSIKVISYGFTEMGLYPQPSSYNVVANALGFTQARIRKMNKEGVRN
ncbi:unnamed protein product [Albugo candida]|uniref:Uncharacterized protein n=1 Tax=Albugo candida TaxID=65357 RepID=A0A024G9X9_9STRA|nr:unnamed protein product [Albugo candida]|eukprot:CCI43444.1 unnamed protein product [Albugo candida]